MHTIIILLVLLFFVIAIFAALKTKSNGIKNVDIWPYYSKMPLSQPEQVLYFRLVQALPNYIVLSQVQLSRLLGVKKGNNTQSWLNRINRMSADFVVCNKDSSIVAVIELDDASHSAKSRKIADVKKDKALKSADIKIIRWNVKSIPDVSYIQSEFKINAITTSSLKTA